MTGPVLVGIDSGGTRTNVEACDFSGGPKLFSYEVGDVLSDTVHYTDYSAVLRRVLAPLEIHWHRAGLSERSASLFMSSAGFSSSSRPDYLSALDEVLPDVLGGRVEAFGAANDAVTLLRGHEADGVVIAGTGSNVLVRTTDGKLHQAGGWGWVASDEGSGFWIGLQAIRQACVDLEDDVDSAILLRLRQLYGVRPQDSRQMTAKFLDLCVADHGMLGEIARFASPVCAAAERGDEVAQNIIKEEAEKLADSTARAIRRRFDAARLSEGLTFVQCGGLMSNDFYRAAYEAQVAMRLLSGRDAPTEVTWIRVTTGIGAALHLAKSLADAGSDLMNVEVGFRPVVVRNTSGP